MDEFRQNTPYTPPQNTSPIPPAAPQGDSGTGAGALIGSIIVILVLVAGAIYFYGKELSTPPAEDTETQDAAAIEESLLNENIDGLDAEFNQDLEAEYQ